MTDKIKHPEFSFDNVGKRMPYRVPDGFFADMANKIVADATAKETQPSQHEIELPTLKKRSNIQRIMFSVAATIALLLSIGYAMRPISTTPDPLSVEQAFSNLSSADQEYILDTFRNEMIIDY